MARAFKGTSADFAQVAIDLSAYTVLTLSFWLYVDSFPNANTQLFELGTTELVAGALGVYPNNNTSGKFAFGSAVVAGSWVDAFTRPSVKAWHHYMLVIDRATPVNAAWVDGVAQTLSTVQHSVTSYGNFGNATLNVMCRNGASAFMIGTLAEVAIYEGVALLGADAQALANKQIPTAYRSANLGPYWPLAGQKTPEPDVSGNGLTGITITGTVSSNGPIYTARAALPGAPPILRTHPLMRKSVVPLRYNYRGLTYTLELDSTSGAEVSTLTNIPEKILSTSEGDVTSIQRNPTKILSVSRPSSSSLVRAPARLLTTAATSIASLIRSLSRSITSTGTDVTSLVKQPSHNLTSTGGDSSLLSRTPSTTLTETAGSSSSLVRSPLRKLSSVGISISSLIRNPLRILTSSGGSSINVTQTPGRILGTTGLSISVLALTITIVLSIVITTIATVVSAVITGGIILTCAGAALVKLVKQPNRTLATSGGDTTILVRTQGRIISTVAGNTSTISRAVSKVIAVVVLPVVALKKQVARILTVSESTTAIVIPVRQKNATLTSTGGDTSSLTRTPLRILVAHGISQSSIVRVVAHTLRYLSVSHIFLSRSARTTLVSSGSGDSSIRITVTRLLTSTGHGLASLASHVFPFVAHLFAISRVYKQWQFDGYKVYEVNRIQQRFSITAEKVYNIRSVFKRWQ